MPTHNHKTGINSEGTMNARYGIAEAWYSWRIQNANSTGWDTFTSSTGGNNPHNNMPPYYAVWHIMKL